MVHVLANAGTLGLALSLSTWGGWFAYVVGQLLLAGVFLHAFVLLHEAGHQTLLPGRRANALVGHLAGFLAVIPYEPWRRIHARHHRYTGWQDLDATTASLVPRQIRGWERRIVDIAWRSWLPLFSILYRIQNYWNLRRIAPFLGNAQIVRKARVNVIALVLVYAALLVWVGPAHLLVLVGPGVFLSLVLEDVLLLSQHTHVPQHLSGGVPVRAFRPIEQAQFTRSLRVPPLLSAAIMHFDAHELHHMYPSVPGYRLLQIDFKPRNEVDWIEWTRAAKRLTGTDFLFRNRNDTGAPV